MKIYSAMERGEGEKQRRFTGVCEGECETPIMRGTQEYRENETGGKRNAKW
jgi:hypothetical protein